MCFVNVIAWLCCITSLLLYVDEQGLKKQKELSTMRVQQSKGRYFQNLRNEVSARYL